MCLCNISENIPSQYTRDNLFYFCYFRYEWKDLGEELPQGKVKTTKTPIFENNLNIINIEDQKQPEGTLDPINLPCGPINCIIFFGVHVYNISNAIVRLILAIQSICGNILDSIIQRHIRLRIMKAFTPSKISNIIDLLESM